MSLVCKWRVFWWRCLGSDALLDPGVMRLQETCWQLILVKGSRGGKLRHNKPNLKLNQWWGCAGGCGGASRMSPQSLPRRHISLLESQSHMKFPGHLSFPRLPRHHTT